MLPGFVDAHSHFSAMMQMASGLDLDDPSLPPVTDIASLRAIALPTMDHRGRSMEIGRALVCTPVTNAHRVCRPPLEKKNVSAVAEGNSTHLNTSHKCNYRM